MSRMRKIIATRMVESLQTSAQLTSVVEVDVSGIAAVRKQAGLSFLPYFALAAVQALAEHRIVNASIVPETHEVEYHPAVHLGIAVDTARGLMVPVIRDAGDLDLRGLAAAIDDVAARTRDNKLKPDEGSGGTFTITNTGSRGALFDTPIINAPQSAILGTGAVVRRPVAVTGVGGAERVEIRSMVYLALSYDHRLVDGADAARFLVAVKDRLEASRS
ncbi:2-oxo acid dehydrogenase subunit E2 [Cryptosporangium sp. NPDC048952]|uniref:2-oxo acid dehydrogenase subunit E2 n=1 Tax=Cryptosporangium sp. NPDC048952 TaxID=3363961 RepID=UPI00371271E3